MGAVLGAVHVRLHPGSAVMISAYPQREGGALPASPDRATHEQSPQAVSAVPVGIPSAEWPCWAAVSTHEEFRNGALVTVTGFRWLFAPTETDAEFGARKWLRNDNPRGRDFEVFVREVPTQAIEGRRAETEGLGAQHESAVGSADAPGT